MNPEVDCMEKWFWEAQSEGGATLIVDGIPCERSKPFVKNFLRDNIPNAADIRIPMGRVGGTIQGLAFVQLSPGVNVKDLLKQVKNLKMGSRRLQITELSGASPTPIRMQSPVTFEK